MKQLLKWLNPMVMIILTVIVFSSLFIGYESTWKFLPVFKYHLLESDKSIEIFVHGYLFDFNLGFFFQLFVLIFSYMIYFSNKRNIAFHMMYILIITRSLLIPIQNSVPPKNYISDENDSTVIYIQLFYLLFFSLLFLLNFIHDTKKRPPLREPHDIIKD